MMNISKLAYFLLSVILFTSILSCKKDEKAQMEYWRMSFRPGNFSINNEAISMTQDASMPNRSLEFIERDSLPNGDYNDYKIRFYFPTLPSLYDISLENIKTELKLTDTTFSELRSEFEFLEHTKFDSLDVAVFELSIIDNDLNGQKDNLKNITFITDAIYISKENGEERKRIVESNIYIKD